MKRIVLTGGQGVGKSSILLALEGMGEYVIFEAAASVRALARASGVAVPEDSPDFLSRALSLHLHRVRLVSPAAPRVFLDRGAPDHLAYARVGHWPLSGEEMEQCLDSRYDLAFLIEPPAGGVAAVSGVETTFCERLVAAIEAAYRSLGIPMLRVPYGTCRNRALFIRDTTDRFVGTGHVSAAE